MALHKIALVTGGSRGLGKSMALALAKKGNDIILTYLTKEAEALDTVKEIELLGQRAAALPLNVADSKSFTSFFNSVSKLLQDHFGAQTFDFLINNAGIGLHTPFAETTEEQFDTMVNVHLKATFFMTQHAFRLMNDGGGIVNVSTGLARFTLPGYAAYATMKGGIETLTKYLAKELGTRQIRVNVIAPGAIETDFGGGQVRDNAELNAFVAAQTALGRVGLPEDIGGVVAFLCSEEGRWVNAQRIEASGGFSL
ncbi:short-chain dehydrogenase [Flavobacterium magnum]|uniref:Short-chain dehydrogenase n=1 Tax=Flavobacterium magnum TaxID=2162713 RepID=A0A2S0RFV3_9FLAO|nr:SDR family oxidoreductase [Flavobacterium magnum]AWA30108.1 short-chain dehydrogenase [Flavobacterium magnum]